jgi:hypothetical protein
LESRAKYKNGTPNLSKEDTMSWLDPRSIESSGIDQEEEAQRILTEFYRNEGELGELVLCAFVAVNPNGFPPEDYTGYARRFIRQALQNLPKDWEERPGLLTETVRRSFHAEQVVSTKDGFVFVSEDHLRRIAEFIAAAVADAGGWKKFCPTI